MIRDATVEIIRSYPAAPERVFDAWLVRANWQAWNGPEGVDCQIEKMDPRVGGDYRLTMNLPGGETMPVAGTYLVIDRPNRLEFSWGHPDTVASTRVELLFRATPNGTQMTLLHHGLETDDHRRSVDGGWGSALAKLGRYLETA